MLTGQSHVSQGLTVQVPDSGAGENFSANESRHSELLLSSHKGPGASCAGQTACASSLIQSSAGRSVSLPEQGLLAQISGPEYSQSGPGGRVLADCEVSSASTMTLLAQDHAEENQDAGLRTTLLPWHKQIINYPLPKKKRNERKNIEKALTVTPKEDSSRVLSSWAVFLSITGSPVETTSHTPGLQVDAGASRIVSSHPVTFSDKTGEGAHLLPGMPAVSSRQQAVPEISCESSEYPSRMETDALTGLCDFDETQVMALFRDWCSRGKRSKKGNRKGNAEKALTVTPKGDSPRVLSSRAVCPSIAGSSAGTTRHTPGLQADVGASRTESSHPVTFSDETGRDGYLSTRIPFHPDQRAVLESFYASNKYPSREEKEKLARLLDTDIMRVVEWFADRRRLKNKRNRSSEKWNKEKNTGEALPVTPKGGSSCALSSRAAYPSITGLSAETTSHTPDAQTAFDAGRIAGNYPVTSFGKTRPGCKFHRARSTFSGDQLAEFRRLFNETEGYPDSAGINNLAASLCLDPVRVAVWFRNERAKNRRNNRNDGENAIQAAPGASRIVGSRTAISSNSKGSIYRCRFPPNQIADCEALYRTTTGFPNRQEKVGLANKLGVDSLRIDTWFKNRRKKDRKEKKSE